MKPPPLNAPFEDKRKWGLKEVLEYIDAIKPTKKLYYCPYGCAPPDDSKSKEVDINTIKMYPWR